MESWKKLEQEILSKKLGIDELPINSGLRGVLEDYVNQINQAMRDKINDQSHAPTTALAKSIRSEKINDSGDTISITTTASDYWKFFDKGVDGLEDKWGAPYSFKFAKPSRSHAEAIRAWIPTTGFFKSPQNYDSIAYAVATNVKKRGLKPKPFVAPILDESPLFKEFTQAVLDITGAHIRVIFIDNEKK
jgi:hypothetical protein